MHRTNNYAYANLIQMVIDIMFLLLTFGLAYLAANQFTGLDSIERYVWILVIFIPFWVFFMVIRGMYNKTTFYYLDRVFRNVLFASVLSVLGTVTMLFFLKDTDTSRLFMGILFILCFVIMFSERSIFSILFKRNISPQSAARIIVVCSRETYLRFIEYLSKTQIRYDIIGVVSTDRLEAERISDARVLGPLENLGIILKDTVVDEVVFALPRQYNGDWQKYIRLCERIGITARIVLDYNHWNHYRIMVSMLGPLPVLTLHTVSLNPFQQYIKRIVDILGSMVGILLTLLISIYVVPAIKLDSPGPIIFKQKRVGRNGRTFNIYKFRTMTVDAESRKNELAAQNEYKDGLMFKIKDDPRITKIGAFLRKTSLDEFPQFFNVLKGDMSLVGTRPPTVDEYNKYDYQHMRRLSIKPGITGVWQVNGRNSIKDFETVVALDIQYIDNWSLRMDMIIMLLTVARVLKMNSAY